MAGEVGGGGGVHLSDGGGSHGGLGGDECFPAIIIPCLRGENKGVNRTGWAGLPALSQSEPWPPSAWTQQ
jgi:hypothetical protein